MTKKRLIRIVGISAIILTIFFLLYWWQPWHLNYKVPIYNTYNINVAFNEQHMQLECTQVVEYTNIDNVAFDKLYFKLYPNAFKYPEQVPVPADEFITAYPKGFAPGYIDIKEVKVNDSTTEFFIQKIGTGQDIILDMALAQSLKPNQTIEIFMRYMVQLPPCQSRFGYGDNSVNITGWYPMLCVYDDQGWNIDPYYTIGDPFYSDTANYNVSITVPQEYTIAHTGKLMKQNKNGQSIQYKIKADKVRDFAWFMSKNYEVIENKVGNTTVKSYSYSTNGVKALEIASKALITFNKLFGEYPYRNLSIAESDFYVGGMEYPQIVQIDSSTYKLSHMDVWQSINREEFSYREDEIWLEYLIVHEIAHQWWYGLVGNNQIEEPWLDEGLTEYATILYFEENYGAEKSNIIQNMFINSSIEQYEMDSPDSQIVNRPIYEFNSWREYSVVVYCKGAVMHKQLRKAMGDEQYLALLRKYYNKYQYCNTTIKDFIDMAYQVGDKEIENMFEKCLDIDYK